VLGTVAGTAVGDIFVTGLVRGAQPDRHWCRLLFKVFVSLGFFEELNICTKRVRAADPNFSVQDLARNSASNFSDCCVDAGHLTSERHGLVYPWLVGFYSCWPSCWQHCCCMAGVHRRCDRRGSSGRQSFCCAPVLRYGRSKPSQRCSQFSRLGGLAVHKFALG